MPFIDLVTGTILCLTVSRGIWVGLIREGLSIVALGAATIAIRIGVLPLSLQLRDWTGGELTGRTSVWIAGILLAVAAVLIARALIRLLKRSEQFAGLGWADRIGGGALGLVEGAVVSAVLLVVVSWWLGPEHPSLADSRSLQAFDQLRDRRGDWPHSERSLPAVAAPGPDRNF